MSFRILVIDDDEDDVKLIDRVLMDHGYVSLLASNGDEALRIAAIQEPDLVLLDIRMPRMDGYEVASSIRTQPGLERTSYDFWKLFRDQHPMIETGLTLTTKGRIDG